jgi:hypothetical protein
MRMAFVSLVVMESGSEWPGHVGNFENLVAVGVEQDQLLERTRARLGQLRREGHHVRVAVLACNAATDARSNDRRAKVASELLDAVATDAFGRIVLTCAETAPARLRQELFSLGGALIDRGTSALVSMRFPEASDPSVRRCLPEVRQPRRLATAAGGRVAEGSWRAAYNLC